MEDYNLSRNEAHLVKYLLTNIASAVCRRLDAVDEQLESVCINTWYIENHVDQLWPHSHAEQSPQSNQLKNASAKQDAGVIDFADLSSSPSIDNNVNIITLNCEDDFPDGSWLGDVNDTLKRVRVPISPIDLTHIHANSQTAVKMALTLLDYLFDRDTQAVSNLSGTGKHSKQQLDPLMIYGIQCHLAEWFGISSCEWQQIRLNIDSKCRSAYRRKILGLPLAVKAFRFRGPQVGTSQLGAESFQHDLEVDGAEEDICVDDDVKVQTLLTGAQLTGLCENNELVHIEVQQRPTGRPVYGTMFDSVVKQTNSDVISSTDEQVTTWTDDDVEVMNE